MGPDIKLQHDHASIAGRPQLAGPVQIPADCCSPHSEQPSVQAAHNLLAEGCMPICRWKPHTEACAAQAPSYTLKQLWVAHLHAGRAADGVLVWHQFHAQCCAHRCTTAKGCNDTQCNVLIPGARRTPTGRDRAPTCTPSLQTVLLVGHQVSCRRARRSPLRRLRCCTARCAHTGALAGPATPLAGSLHSGLH